MERRRDDIPGIFPPAVSYVALREEMEVEEKKMANGWCALGPEKYGVPAVWTEPVQIIKHAR